ncbi:hypothetical protein [Aequorivita viscosa]|uniref:Uncharacterized protein n=1 Tax=Aequorivita viscosa TaxID=797419 RepID=A0A1M6KKT2_9FLAO|nr:hypothetical protein [Aequorivita viscosa]SDX19231.1 hypothetical protein SAMN05216556_1205 [Aequorivita viscosa]SHJ59553.1 hypothetical protein SAMN04487908_12067 [Aequorivita viscosa]
MRKSISHSLKSLLSNIRQRKDKQLLKDYIIRTIEDKTGKPIQLLRKNHTQRELYKIGLYYVTTTNKAICEALKIPVEAGTRRKRELEKEGRLIASAKKRICPFTKHPARFLTTNPDQYRELLK